MKLMAFFLCITLMALSVMPCSDIHAQPDLHRQTTFQEAGSNHGDHQDHCSPFCLCNCCARTLTLEATGLIVTNLSSLAPIKKTKYWIQNESFDGQFFASILQPPKL